MRNLHVEAEIWNLFTSAEFFGAAARECEEVASLYASTRTREGIRVAPDKEMVDKFIERARGFRRGVIPAQFDDYQCVFETAGWIHSDIRNIIEKTGWSELARLQDFSSGRLERLGRYCWRIESALVNALTGADSFFHPNPDCPERSDDDDGYPGGDIIGRYEDYVEKFGEHLVCALPDPLPEYVIDLSIACRTGDRVPWTGVWYPSSGLERYSLTFAIKGGTMQPVYRVVRTVDELRTEKCMFPSPETVAVTTTWHPVIRSGRYLNLKNESFTKAAQT
ncbi:hypothetical protein ACSUZJ_22535 [Telluria sp. B2]